MITRSLIERIRNRLNKGKAIVLVGPRQVGKTTLINELLKGVSYLFLDGDASVIMDTLANANTETLKSIIGDYKYVFIDEVQR
ncbi:AAA family ATPase, partial [Flavobacterium sp.]|uniref:AAA family ATPase n=1 Tax=Flavobacterium sp. TaxID=239 RepID=UPI0026326274